MSKNDPHRLIQLVKLGRIERCGLIGEGVSLGTGLEVSKASAMPS